MTNPRKGQAAAFRAVVFAARNRKKDPLRALGAYVCARFLHVENGSSLAALMGRDRRTGQRAWSEALGIWKAAGLPPPRAANLTKRAANLTGYTSQSLDSDGRREEGTSGALYQGVPPVPRDANEAAAGSLYRAGCKAPQVAQALGHLKSRWDRYWATVVSPIPWALSVVTEYATDRDWALGTPAAPVEPEPDHRCATCGAAAVVVTDDGLCGRCWAVEIGRSTG